jgi:hypothetical protein
MSRKPSVGVLTFHRCINYGSYWQACCLVDALRARGHDAVLIDHSSRRINLAEWKCGLRPVLPSPVPRRDYLLYGVKMLRFFRAFAALPLSASFPLEHPDEMDGFDQVVVGSDEVWNLRHPWYGGCSLFFGSGLRARRLVSYAASFGNYDASEGLPPARAAQLRRFQAISVRDTNSCSLIRTAVGVDPELVLDPCLLFPPQPQRRRLALPRGFALVYGHNFSAGFARKVRDCARQAGCRLVSIGYRNDWADEQWITADPHGFANAVAGARAVVTNFFHGCVFALRNARPLVCETTPYRSIKVRNLLGLLGGEQHLVGEDTPAAEYERRLCEPPSAEVLQRIIALRQQSEAYLQRALA